MRKHGYRSFRKKEPKFDLTKVHNNISEAINVVKEAMENYLYFLGKVFIKASGKDVNE